MAEARRNLAGQPLGEVSTPVAVRELAAGRTVTPVWANELGGITFEVGAGSDGDERVFVKWSPVDGPDLSAEAERLGWARRHVVVPEVLAVGADDDGSWMVTAALPGTTAVSPRWIAEPQTAVSALGVGLRALHDALPVDGCPWSWSVTDRGAHADDTPSIDRLVVCHGDACAPNTMLDDEGRYTGHVDFGRMGVADRWADLAVATWSTVWNYGPGHEDRLLAAYGIAPDEERTEYYRWLWDLASDAESARRVEPRAKEF